MSFTSDAWRSIITLPDPTNEYTEECEETDIEHDEYDECVQIAGDWGIFLGDHCRWDDSKKPFVNFRKFEDFELTEYENEGVLSDRIIASKSSYLCRTPETLHYALVRCDLSLLIILKDISILKYYHYLEYLDLSYNQITDLEALGQLPLLMYLNVSHNQINSLLNFKAPYNLVYANFAHNKIPEMNDLDEFWSLKTLIISNNFIRFIDGVNNLRFLRVLDLSSNKISRLNNLEGLRLRELHLKNNLIHKFDEKFNTLDFIRSVDLSNNNLTSLQLFAQLHNIEVLDVSQNSINHLLELSHLEGLRYLMKLKLAGNPIAHMRHYFNLCIYFIRNLNILDDEFISPRRKQCATSVSNLEMKASINRSCLTAVKNLHLADITTYAISCNQQLKPILLLIGLPGSRVKEVMNKLCEKLQCVSRGVGTTTRPKSIYEVDGIDYHFITRDEFEKKMSNGDFVSATTISGFYYGIEASELSKGVDCALLFYTNLEIAFMLRVKGYSPKLIFCLPRSKETHMKWLKQNYYYYYNDEEHYIHIEYSPESVERAKEHHREMRKLEILDDMRDLMTEIVDKASSSKHESKNDKKQKRKTKKVHIEQLKSSVLVKLEQEPVEDFQFKAKEDVKNVNVEKLELRISSGEPLFSDTRSPILRAPANSLMETDVEDVATMMHSVSEIIMYNSEVQAVEIQEASMVLSVLSDTGMVKKHWERLCKDIDSKVLAYYDSVMVDREELIGLHASNVGLFHETIFTDEVNESVVKIKKFIKRVLKHYTSTPEDFFKNNITHDHMVSAKLKRMHKEINLQMSTGDRQRAQCNVSNSILETGWHTNECLMRQNLQNYVNL